MFKENKKEFDETAKKWTLSYANKESLEEQKILKITEMGFSRDEAINALKQSNWDENIALQLILN
jgi:ubiquitin-conjugating enzyme (huntingtin interacting protein 2)